MTTVAAKLLSIVQIASLGTIGDNIYRVHQPCAARAQLPGAKVFEVHAQSRHWDAAALAADVLVLTMTLDVEVHRLIHQRKQLGKLTICEVNDYLPDVQASNPAHRTWADPAAFICLSSSLPVAMQCRSAVPRSASG